MLEPGTVVGTSQALPAAACRIPRLCWTDLSECDEGLRESRQLADWFGVLQHGI